MSNPNNTFPMAFISRAEIAHILNSYMGIRNYTDSFADDDDRLTDSICSTFAKGYGRCAENSREWIIVKTLTALGITIKPDSDPNAKWTITKSGMLRTTLKFINSKLAVTLLV